MKGKEIRILFLLGLDTLFFFLEIGVGYAVNSLALVADAFHMLNDIISLVVALWAVKVAKSRGVDSKYTYGWQRAEILGALINAVFLIALCMTIFLEAIQRFIEVPEITNPKLILVVGTAGLISNIVGLFLFHEHGHSHGGSSGHIEDEESGHSHEHSHSHSNNHSHTHHNVDVNYRRNLVDDDAPISGAVPSSYVSKISETTGLLANESTGAANYDSVDENSSVNENPTELYTDASPPSHHSHRNRAQSVSSITHKGHFHAKPKQSIKQKSLNMEGVFLHVLGDALGNIGVIATALFIWKTDYSWKFYMDPVISLVITAIIFSSAVPLCKRTSAILLQGVPQSIDADEVRDDIASLPGVIEVHDLHIWILSENLNIATLHVSVDKGPKDFMKLAKRIRTCMKGHGIGSTTIQPEFVNFSSASSSRSSSPENTPSCILQGNKSSGGLSRSHIQQ